MGKVWIEDSFEFEKEINDFAMKIEKEDEEQRDNPSMICKRLEIYEKTYFRLRLKTMDFLLPLIPTKFTYSVSVEIFMDITKEINETYVVKK